MCSNELLVQIAWVASNVIYDFFIFEFHEYKKSNWTPFIMKIHKNVCI